MGLFAGRTARFDHAAIAEEMRPALYGFFNARLQIFDPKTSTATGRYDPKADTGGSVTAPELLYDTGENGALVQPIRSPIAVQFGDQTTHILGIRFQMTRPQEALVLRAGLRVVIVDGGNAPEISEYAFSINEGFEPSTGWGKIIEASTITSNVS